MPHDDSQADHDRSIDDAFFAWQEARGRLGHLRAQTPGAGQLAAPSEVLAHVAAIRSQEALCEGVWGIVTQPAKVRAAGEVGQGTISLPIKHGSEGARRAFEIWATAEQAAQTAERELLATMRAEMPITDEFLQSVRSNRANAHSLFSAALREMKERAASLHHRNILAAPGGGAR